jgi:hypothetical protein
VCLCLARLFSADAVPELGGNPPRLQWVWLDWWSRWPLVQLVFFSVSIPIYEPKSVRDLEFCLSVGASEEHELNIV